MQERRRVRLLSDWYSPLRQARMSTPLCLFEAHRATSRSKQVARACIGGTARDAGEGLAAQWATVSCVCIAGEGVERSDVQLDWRGAHRVQVSLSARIFAINN